MVKILVAGATGKLGRIVTRQLLERGAQVRVLARRPTLAREQFGAAVEIAAGDFDDAASLRAAAAGTDRAFLLSPIGEHLVRHQTAFIDGAVASSVRRIVKISGSDWTITPDHRSISGDAHSAVEAHLAAQPIESVSIRPSAWMQVSLPPLIAAAEAGRPLFAPYGNAPVGFIDARDIADVAVHQLLAAQVEPSPLVITGPEALRLPDIAAILLHQPVGTTSTRPAAAPPPPLPPDSFHGRAVAEFMVLIRDGRAAALTDTVTRLLGRAPRSIEAFLSEHLRAAAA
jgi:uncharacterized protein YbjT (DUF2867 family)